ncbi:hypothetical protein, partial [Armatimonas sp.]|uniref:hypothetical protein n=1 Tax=Armatimonas sp. TaxID=1872638 RepID=UPI00286C1C5A
MRKILSFLALTMACGLSATQAHQKTQRQQLPPRGERATVVGGVTAPLAKMTDKNKGRTMLTAATSRLVTGATRRRLVLPVQRQIRSDVSVVSEAAASATLKKEKLPASAYAPQSVNFGELKVKQAVRTTITVVCPTDGEVSVRYKDKLSQTNILQLSVFGGDWSSDEPQSASPVLIRTSNNGRISAKAGQELRIELEFVCAQTGRINGTLEVSGDDWQASIPTTAAVSLLGPLVGALILPVDR